MPDKSLLKVICLCSLITGAILGVFPLIQKLIGMAFFLVMFLSAPFVIGYLFKLKLITEADISRCLVIGFISGFCAFLGFSFVYFPIALILNLIFKIDYFVWIKVIFVNIGFLIPMVVLTALLSGLFNMFSALVAVQLYEYFKPKNRG